MLNDFKDKKDVEEENQKLETQIKNNRAFFILRIAVVVILAAALSYFLSLVFSPIADVIQ